MSWIVGVALLCLVCALLWWAARSPYIGLGLLVAGMAFHNFALMVLLRLGTPSILIRLVQAWKELLLALLTVIALNRIWKARETGALGRLIPTDWLAIAFGMLTIVYFALPPLVLYSDANLQQRLVGLHTILLIPLLYFLGRVIAPRGDRESMSTIILILGAASAVTIFGSYEVLMIPTRTWLDWGVKLYTSFLGFTYHGPAGLPENFFITLGDGTLVRRMVSTYISPLGIAYTGLVVFPMAVTAMDRQSNKRIFALLVVATTLLMLGVALSITRLALLAMIGEAVVIGLMLRSRWASILVPVAIAITLIALYPYVAIAPAVDRNLHPVQRTGSQWAMSTNDSSFREHFDYLVTDVKVDLAHPLGLGTGGSTVRYGKLAGTGESAVLGMFGDLGLVGGGLYVALYLLAMWHGWKALRRTAHAPLQRMLPMVAFAGGLALAPVTMTSDVWGAFSVTFLLWWAAGASAAMTAPVPGRATGELSTACPGSPA